MAMLAEARQWFEQWIAAVATAVDGVAGMFMRRRSIELDENGDGTFTARLVVSKDGSPSMPVSFRLDHDAPQPPLPAEWKTAFDGSRIEVRLRSDQIVSRVLDFPSQASDFLDGMIRAQVDRLTPWSAADAVFGWSSPQPIANDRIEVAFGATAAAKVDPLIRMARMLGAASVAVFAPAVGGDGAAQQVTLLDKSLRGLAGPSVPRLLRVGLVSTAAAAAGSLLLNIYLGGRAAIRAGRSATPDRAAPRRAASRCQWRLVRARPAGQAQADDAVERHGPGSGLARAARHDLCDGASHRGQQGAGGGTDPGCAIPDPVAGAVAAIHPRDVLRADDACGK
ncbi:general secretion pathway protein L [Bradyrhizobium sp. USDA 4529]